MLCKSNTGFILNDNEKAISSVEKNLLPMSHSVRIIPEFHWSDPLNKNITKDYNVTNIAIEKRKYDEIQKPSFQ